MSILLAMVSAALAECPTAYARDQYMGDLAIGTGTIKELEGITFQAAAASLEKGLVCVVEAVPAAAYATAYRYIGVMHWAQGDEEGSRRWFRTALELDPTYEWDLNDIPSEHPIRMAFEDARFVASSLPEKKEEGMFLVAPAGSSFLLDGRPWSTPEATLDRPHVFQEMKDDQVVFGAIIESNEFPAQYLLTEKERQAELAAQARDNKKSKGGTTTTTTDESDSYAVTAIRRERPPAKTPLLVTGAVGLLGGGFLYWQSMQARDSFDAATTTEDVNRYQKATNTTFLLAAGSATLGLGLGYYGVILDAGPMIGFSFEL